MLLDMDPRDRLTVDTGVLVKVLQDIPVRCPRRYHTQLGTVPGAARDHIGAVHPHCDLLLIALIGE